MLPRLRVEVVSSSADVPLGCPCVSTASRHVAVSEVARRAPAVARRLVKLRGCLVEELCGFFHALFRVRAHPAAAGL
jgi:hypothetical protein